MDEILANKIAAGEVVERCASVVKELVENSIDADSHEIKIELKEAGTSLIKVTDDGTGMDKDDAVVAFSRHATSKIKDESDLYNISTLGFRGEALASIASVSNVLLKTSQGEVGTLVNIKGGKLIKVEKTDARKGTVIEVSELFYNTPARLKHMKSLYTELASITDYVNKIALSHPEIRFTLINNNNIILKTDGSNNLLKTISAIYGMDVARKMLEINGEDDDYIISGFISLPEVNRAGRNHMVTLVNGRVVRNQELNKTINDSYHSYKPDNRYPIVVINIELDPILVDVNIHPTKMDIKFSKLEELQQLIQNIITNRLDHQTLIPQANIVVNSFEDNDSNYDQDSKPYQPNLPKYEEITLDFSVKEESEYVKTINEDIERFPLMYPIGLVHGTYIVCQNDTGMYLIDQHAAKERVNYEIFKEKLANPLKENIAMLLPMTIELSNKEYIILKENFDLLENMGFEIAEFGINSIIIKAHPTWLTDGFENLQIQKIVEAVIHKEKDFDLAKFNDHLAATLACKASIKAHTEISLDEMRALISDLSKCHNPFNCPHGRPTVVTFTTYDLEKLFKRSGFESLK